MLPILRAALPVEISGSALFTGDDACLTVGLLAGLQAARPGQPLLVVDGANAFDPFLIATLARRTGLFPKAVLDEIRISRVFTCHQLEALLSGRLQESLRKFGGKAVLFSGLLDPLLDDEVTTQEASRIFRLIPPALKELSAGCRLGLCVCPHQPVPTGREWLLTALQATAEWAFELSRQDDVVRITCTKPHPGTWTWEPEIGMLVARRWW